MKVLIEADESVLIIIYDEEYGIKDGMFESGEVGPGEDVFQQYDELVAVQCLLGWGVGGTVSAETELSDDVNEVGGKWD